MIKLIATMYILNKSIRLHLSSNDDKRLQTFDKTATCPYGANR